MGDLVMPLFAGATQFASSLIAAKSQEDSNKTYLKGVRETNEANRQLYEQQQRDNRQNWVMENNYNSPSSQLARLRMAGINTIGSVGNGNSLQVQSATPQPAVAPSQTPVVNYGAGLNDAVRNVADAYQQQQSIQDSKYHLYQKGIESQFYLRAQLNQLRLQEAEILSKETLTESDKQRLLQLRIDSKYYEDNLRRQMTINDETWQNLQKSGRAIDKQIERDDALAVANMQHMNVEEAVDWYNAHTGRQVAENDARRIGNEYAVAMRNLYQQFARFKWDVKVQRHAGKLADKYFKLSAAEKRIARAIMAQQLRSMKLDAKRMEQLMNSPFGTFIRYTLGLDPASIGSAAVGAGAAMMLK